MLVSLFYKFTTFYFRDLIQLIILLKEILENSYLFRYVSDFRDLYVCVIVVQRRLIL